MKYDVVLVVKDVWGFNPSEAKEKAIKRIYNSKIEKTDLDAFCHQVDGGRKKV